MYIWLTSMNVQWIRNWLADRMASRQSTDTAAYDSADGSMFPHEMTSKPPCWKCDIKSKMWLCRCMCRTLKNNYSQFQPNPIWNDRAVGSFEECRPNQVIILGRNNKMSSNMGSVPDPRTLWQLQFVSSIPQVHNLVDAAARLVHVSRNVPADISTVVFRAEYNILPGHLNFPLLGNLSQSKSMVSGYLYLYTKIGSGVTLLECLRRARTIGMCSQCTGKARTTQALGTAPSIFLISDQNSHSYGLQIWHTCSQGQFRHEQYIRIQHEKLLSKK